MKSFQSSIYNFYVKILFCRITSSEDDIFVPKRVYCLIEGMSKRIIWKRKREMCPAFNFLSFDNNWRCLTR